MTETLAHALLEQGLVTKDDMETALERQVVQGGSLDTILLESNLISEDDLLLFLGSLFALPTAGREEIHTIEPYLPKLFPKIFAETYHLVPFRLVGDNLSVLMQGAPDKQLFARIQERLQLNVSPTLTTEVRLHYAMHRLYDVALLPRFQSLLAKLDGEDLMPSEQAADKPAEMLSWGLPTGEITRSGFSRRNKDPVKVKEWVARINRANNRDAIIDVVLEITLTAFEFAAIFLVHGKDIHGWRGSDPAATQQIARISMSVELPSVFQTIYATEGHYLGPLPGNSANTQLMESLGRASPRTAFLAPLLVGGKLAAIVYADNGTQTVSPKRVAAILLLLNRSGLCLENLIRKRKEDDTAPPKQEVLPNAGKEPEPDEITAVEVEAPPFADAGSDTDVLLDHKKQEEPLDPELALSPESLAEEAIESDQPEELEETVVTEGNPSLVASATQDIAETELPSDSASANLADLSAHIEVVQEENKEANQASDIPPIELPEIPVAVAGEETNDQDDDASVQVWESVDLDAVSMDNVDGNFTQDGSTEAATHDFEQGVRESAAPPDPEEQAMAAEVEALAEKVAKEAEPYIAFADIDESPEESVEDWEDVLVEAVGTEKPSIQQEAKPKKPSAFAPPAVTWEDVVAEAEAAPLLTPAPAASVEVAGTKVDEGEILLDSLESNDPQVWKPAIDRLLQLGQAYDAELEQRFPGNVQVDPFLAQTQLPRFQDCSGMTAYAAQRGPGAARVVLPSLESDNRNKRFFAIYFLYSVFYPAGLELLARRLYDAEPRNRFLAADALRNYRREDAYQRIVQGLRDHLKVPVFEAQVATVQVLGQLRDPSAVPSLIPFVVSPRVALSRAATSALTVICGQSFGPEVASWAEWWQSHYNKPRESWLLEGMRHADEQIRQIASREFQMLNQHKQQAQA